MRDPERIQHVLKLVEAIWMANPDLRLMQLLIGAAHHAGFNMEDDELMELLREYYGVVE
jgi:uncharacterized protein YihD (DUF1040 family)